MLFHFHTILNSDTLFYEDFTLDKIVEQYLSSPAPSENGAFVTYYQCEDQGQRKQSVKCELPISMSL